jgi:hypothetical protein
MFQKLINTFIHLPMVWDVIIPLAIIGLLCSILFWEGLYGHASRFIKKIRGIQPEDKNN